MDLNLENQAAQVVLRPPIPSQPLQSNPPQQQNYLPGVRQLLGQSWEIYKNRWKTLVAISLIPFAFSLALFSSGAFLGFFQSHSLEEKGFSRILLVAIVVLFAWFVGVWSRIALIYAIKSRSEQIGFRVAFGKGIKKIFPFILLSILIGIINGLGVLLLIIPGIIFSIWFSFAIYVFIAEDAGIIEALKRSKEYVSGKFVEVVYRLIGGISMLILGTVILAVIPMVNFTVGLVSAFIIDPLIIIYSILLYENLKNLSGKTISNPAGKGTVILLIIIIAVFLASIILPIYLILLNPFRQIALANNTRRSGDVNAILNSVSQYMADNKGVIPSEITTTTKSISNTGANLCNVLVPGYLAALPVDPSINGGVVIKNCTTAYNTGYTIVRNIVSNKITVSAPAAELKESISVTR